MKEIKVFESATFGKVRTIVLEGVPWFVGKDIATALGYMNPRKALADHVDKEDRTKGIGCQNNTPSGERVDGVPRDSETERRIGGARVPDV